MLALFSRQCFFSSHQPYLTYLGRRVIFRTPSACCSVKVLICSSFVNKVCFLIPVIMQILQTVWLCCAAASPLGWKYLEATEPQNFVFLRNRCFPVGGGVRSQGFRVWHECCSSHSDYICPVNTSLETFQSVSNVFFRNRLFKRSPASASNGNTLNAEIQRLSGFLRKKKREIHLQEHQIQLFMKVKDSKMSKLNYL